MFTSRETTLIAKARASAVTLGVPVYVVLPGGITKEVTK